MLTCGGRRDGGSKTVRPKKNHYFVQKKPNDQLKPSLEFSSVCMYSLSSMLRVLPRCQLCDNALNMVVKRTE